MLNRRAILDLVADQGAKALVGREIELRGRRYLIQDTDADQIGGDGAIAIGTKEHPWIAQVYLWNLPDDAKIIQ